MRRPRGRNVFGGRGFPFPPWRRRIDARSRSKPGSPPEGARMSGARLIGAVAGGLGRRPRPLGAPDHGRAPERPAVGTGRTRARRGTATRVGVPDAGTLPGPREQAIIQGGHLLLSRRPASPTPLPPTRMPMSCRRVSCSACPSTRPCTGSWGLSLGEEAGVAGRYLDHRTARGEPSGVRRRHRGGGEAFRPPLMGRPRRTAHRPAVRACRAPRSDGQRLGTRNARWKAAKRD